MTARIRDVSIYKYRDTKEKSNFSNRPDIARHDRKSGYNYQYEVYISGRFYEWNKDPRQYGM